MTKPEGTLLNVRDLQGKPAFIVTLFDDTQVKWKVFLHPLKITFSLRKEKKER